MGHPNHGARERRPAEGAGKLTVTSSVALALNAASDLAITRLGNARPTGFSRGSDRGEPALLMHARARRGISTEDAERAEREVLHGEGSA